MAMTTRTKQIKQNIEEIVKQIDNIETAWQRCTDFFNEWNTKASIYSREYISAKQTEQRMAAMRTIHACAEKGMDAAKKLRELCETDPEPVSVSDEDTQNMLTLFKLTDGKIDFRQQQYFIDRSRGHFSLLKMLADVFDNYGMKYSANRARELAAELSPFKLDECISKFAGVLYNEETYQKNTFYWQRIELKEYAANLDPTVVESPDYEAQVQRYKKELRRAEEEKAAAQAEAKEKGELVDIAVEKIVELESGAKK